ncbi:hypothetical protein J2S43_003402 [Catenuloplanes nepalensis]|uniref:Uncharacterized protein n=1 Tax=Catenuloplanes nepalensis TaxID=587533 RepID=A0ABT9MTX9_9ACTN|nr:hypothetical protein [Catenuloplanes nepalensis]MDP9794890.1 hypothetical protein [Catenuloplanes nepalensis]
MTDELDQEVRRVAAAPAESMPELDYSVQSLNRIETMLAEASSS